MSSTRDDIIQLPRVGDAVYFYDHHHDYEQSAAIVTNLYGTSPLVDLTVFRPGTMPIARIRVPVRSRLIEDSGDHCACRDITN